MIWSITGQTQTTTKQHFLQIFGSVNLCDPLFGHGAGCPAAMGFLPTTCQAGRRPLLRFPGTTGWYTVISPMAFRSGVQFLAFLKPLLQSFPLPCRAGPADFCLEPGKPWPGRNLLEKEVDCCDSNPLLFSHMFPNFLEDLLFVFTLNQCLQHNADFIISYFLVVPARYQRNLLIILLEGRQHLFFQNRIAASHPFDIDVSAWRDVPGLAWRRETTGRRTACVWRSRQRRRRYTAWWWTRPVLACKHFWETVACGMGLICKYSLGVNDGMLAWRFTVPPWPTLGWTLRRAWTVMAAAAAAVCVACTPSVISSLYRDDMCACCARGVAWRAVEKDILGTSYRPHRHVNILISFQTA